MSENVGGIFWQVDADTRGAVNSIRDVERQTKRTEKGFMGLDGSAQKMASGLSKVFAGVSAGLLVRQLVNVQREFDKLNAAVITSTGGVENAAIAFEALEKFAAETPYALEQSVTAFTKLVNFGLTPSERAMKSYGDTASAMGKDLNQMIEAVADAATGEFERLKEFGIKSKNQGDTIAFTFRGTTQTVKNSAEEIESYLIKLGENNFAGSMANRMNTLDGKISNLGDTWDKLFRTVSSQGAGTMMASGVDLAIEAIQSLINLIESGQLDGIISTVASAWRASFGNIANDISTMIDHITSEFGVVEKAGGQASDFLSNAFFEFPANIKAAIQIATVEILGFVDIVKIQAQKMDAYLNPKNWFNGSDVGGYFDKQIKVVQDRVTDMASDILEVRNKEIASVNKEREAVERNKIEWKKNQEAKRNASGKTDVLAGFGVEPDTTTPTPPTNAENKERDTALKMAQSVIDSGKTPVERLEEEHAKLLELKKKYVDDSAVFQEAITANEKKQADLRLAYNVANANMALSSASQLFGGIADVMKNSEGEQSTAYKAMFALSKGFAVAQAGLNLGLALSNAIASGPFPWNMAAVASVGTAATGFMTSIAGATYGGRENGGSVLANKTYEVGEKNKPELLMIPGNNGKVLSNSEMKGMMGGNGGGSYQPIINNYASNDGYSVQYRRDELTKKDVFDIVQNEMTNPNSIGRRGMSSNTNLSGVLNGNRRS